MDYYELFDIPAAPVVDKTHVAKKFFDLQKKYHPDFYAQADEEEKEAMMQQSAHVNKAYKIFQKEEDALEYFLQHRGVIIPGEKYPLPNDFLMEMMELNESLTEDDDVAFDAKLAPFENALEASVAKILNKESATSLTEKDFAALKEYYYKKKYLKRILDRIRD